MPGLSIFGSAAPGQGALRDPLPLTPSHKAAGDDALRKSATEFEAVAIGELLAPMFETVDTAHGMFGGGDGESAWRPMMVQAIGRQIAAHGGLGLGDAIYRTLMRAQETRQASGR